MRAIWSGALSFGLIYIPVKLYDATRSHSIDFDLLRRSDRCKIHYARVCRETNEEVPLSDIVKGYEYQKGEYVVLEDEDFKRASVHKSQTIEILSFVDASEIDQKFLEKPYYLEPVREAKKAYVLLREALRRCSKVGIGRFVLKTREHLVLLNAQEDVIVLNQMRYADELRPSTELDLPEKGSSGIERRELDMAAKLVEQLSEPWRADRYKDSYFEDLRAVIQQKVEGKLFEPVHEEPAAATPVADLFSRLSESLEMLKAREK